LVIGISSSMSACATARITEPRAKGIVARVRRDELSTAPLQSRPASARHYLDAENDPKIGRHDKIFVIFAEATGEVARVMVVDHAIATR
jgi:hypothetical protein